MAQTLFLLAVENEGEPGVSRVFLWALHSCCMFFCVFSEVSTLPQWVNNILPITPVFEISEWMRQQHYYRVTIIRVTFLPLLTFPLVYQCPRAKSNSPTSSCHSCCWQLSPVHFVVIHLQAVLCFSVVRQWCSKTLFKEPARQLLQPEPRLCGPGAPLSHHNCVWLWLDFTPAARGAAGGCLHHHSCLSQNMPPLSLNWRAQGSWVGHYSKADLRDHLAMSASPSLQHLRCQHFFPSQGWKTSQGLLATYQSLCSSTWVFALCLLVTQLGKCSLCFCWYPMMKCFHSLTEMCVAQRETS